MLVAFSASNLGIAQVLDGRFGLDLHDILIGALLIVIIAALEVMLAHCVMK